MQSDIISEAWLMKIIDMEMRECHPLRNYGINGLGDEGYIVAAYFILNQCAESLILMLWFTNFVTC